MAYSQRRMVYAPPQQKEEEEPQQETQMSYRDSELFNFYLTQLWNLKTTSKAKHWTTTGANFMSVHELYDMIYDFAEEAIDEIAENLTSYDFSFRIVTAEIASIDNVDEGSETWLGMLREEFGSMMKIKKSLEVSIEQADEQDLIGLQNILEEQMTKLDKILYFTKQTIGKG